MKKILVMGIGNILLKDEGVGVYCVRALREKLWPKNVYFIEGGTFTQDIFCSFENFHHLLVLDAVQGGKKPGTLYRLEEKDLLASRNKRISLHEINLLDSLKMAELLGTKFRLTILGIEPEMVIWEMGLTHTLKNAFDGLVEMATKEINSIISKMDY
jgi:hydrogenase maturation protease